MTVATRVAAEMGCSVGQAVGYSIRFEDLSTPVRSISFSLLTSIEMSLGPLNAKPRCSKELLQRMSFGWLK